MKNYSLKKEIGKITKRLIQFYKPQKIVIFGSSATGKKTGDIDMLIVKETKENFFIAFVIPYEPGNPINSIALPDGGECVTIIFFLRF